MKIAQVVAEVIVGYHAKFDVFWTTTFWVRTRAAKKLQFVIQKILPPYFHKLTQKVLDLKIFKILNLTDTVKISAKMQIS